METTLPQPASQRPNNVVSLPSARVATLPEVRPVREPAVRALEIADPREVMERLLDVMVQRKASDLHLTSENAPAFRIDGAIATASEMGVLSARRLEEILFSIAPERNREEWKARRDTDFAYETAAARYRVNLYADRQGIAATLRLIPRKIRTTEELELPQAVIDLCNLRKGLVIVTGPTGSGKSTTLAAMIDYVNRTRTDHIVSFEDPIEFVHQNKKCLVNQREVGTHTDSFKQALRAALREDPDVVLVGEMRDLETVAIALETAETGHLVFATLHTNTAASTVDRIVDQFPADRQQQVRMMLAESLKGVVAQTLCPKIGGGRVAALKVLLCSGAVSNLIRESKTYQIPSVMQTNKSYGMQPMNDALVELVKRKLIDPDAALSRATSRTDMRTALDKAGFSTPAPSFPRLARTGT